MTLVKYGQSMPSLTSWIDDFFSTNLLPSFGLTGRLGWNMPAVNVRETHDNYELEVAAPGYSKKDFNVAVDNGLLTISAEKEGKEEERNDSYTRREFAYRSFSRTFTLPDGVKDDDIKANYEDGILHVVIPKTEEAKGKAPRTIKIS
ncbi:MAG TPA: Hsp20/alpha crystallin family protein [Chitinophagales bacterium]|nr:Hsp20/alpha crystallin family protein [Chitinophagales bacterium]